MGYDRYVIARGVGVKEKAVRMWLNGDHASKLEHAIALERFYKKAKRTHA
jgi:hypothetical protein